MTDIRTLAGSFRRYPDPESSTDPAVSALIGHLRTLSAGPSMRADFRSELHAQLVAVTPRLVAEGVADDEAAPTGRFHSGWRWLHTRASLMSMRRPIAVVGSLMVVFALLLTGAVWMSSRTLPGDSLYGLKRASENVQLSLISGDGARGREYLSLATKRAKEVSSLLSKSAAFAVGTGPQAMSGLNSHTAGLIADTLAAADSDLRSGSRLLTGQAVHNTSNGPLVTLRGWAPGQVARLHVVVNRVAAGSLHQRALASEQLVQRVLERANRLSRNIGCSCLRGTSTDDLGPLPCQSACNPPVPVTTPNPGTKPAPTGVPSIPPTSSPGRVTSPATSPASRPSGAATLPPIPGLPGSGGASTGHTSGAPSGTGGLSAQPPSSSPVSPDHRRQLRVAGHAGSDRPGTGLVRPEPAPVTTHTLSVSRRLPRGQLWQPEAPRGTAWPRRRWTTH